MFFNSSRDNLNFFVNLRSCIQHIFNKDAVARGGVINKHMGDRPHQLAVLDDGAAAHV